MLTVLAVPYHLSPREAKAGRPAYAVEKNPVSKQSTNKRF